MNDINDIDISMQICTNIFVINSCYIIINYYSCQPEKVDAI